MLTGWRVHLWDWTVSMVARRLRSSSNIDLSNAVNSTHNMHIAHCSVSKPWDRLTVWRPLLPYVICNFWHPGTLTLRAERQSARMSNYKWQLNPVWHRMLYSCTTGQQWASKWLKCPILTVTSWFKRHYKKSRKWVTTQNWYRRCEHGAAKTFCMRNFILVPHMSHNCLSSVSQWVSEQCFTSPPTQYRLYGRRFLQVKRPNQQYQSTEGDATKEKENNENN